MRILNIKIYKWMLPVFCYVFYIILWYIYTKFEQAFMTFTDAGHIPESVITFLALPLIPIGYALLLIAQQVYKKNRKGYWLFAFLTTIIPVILHIIAEYIMLNGVNNWGYTLLRCSSPITFFTIPFFLCLASIFRKEQR